MFNVFEVFKLKPKVILQVVYPNYDLYRGGIHELMIVFKYHDAVFHISVMARGKDERCAIPWVVHSYVHQQESSLTCRHHCKPVLNVHRHWE